MTALDNSQWPCGATRSQNNAFTSAPPKGCDKPVKHKPKRIKLPAALQAAISLETTEERQARKASEATAFIHYGGICDFGVTPDHMSIEVKASKLTGKRVRLGRDI